MISDRPTPDAQRAILDALDGHARHTAAQVDRVHVCDALTLLRALPDGYVDLVVTSPPYNMRRQTNGAKACSNSVSNWSKSKLLSAGYESVDDAMPADEYIRWQRAVLKQCMRVTKPTGAIFYNHKWRIQGGLLDMRSDIVAGFPVRQVIIWNRGSSNNHNRAFFAPQYEVIYLIAKRRFYIRQDATAFGDVWYFPPVAESDHPAPFPFELARRCIVATDAKLICDPFIGSGTTALVAKALGRHYIGGDLSPAYVDIARARLALPYTPDMFETLRDPQADGEAAGVEQLELFAGVAR
jgi:site-specific DNA-methyltransferase (adenine-specific)